VIAFGDFPAGVQQVVQDRMGLINIQGVQARLGGQEQGSVRARAELRFSGLGLAVQQNRQIRQVRFGGVFVDGKTA